MARRDVLSHDLLAPDATTNLALWLDRYPWDLELEAIGQHHLVTLDKVRVPEGYSRAYDRRKRSLIELAGAFEDGETRLFTLELIGRAVVGIGAASVRETNLQLLRPWGVPCIPGSSLKGVASHEAHARGGDWAKPAKPGEKAARFHHLVFGDVDGAGAVVFHDAWWTPEGDHLPLGPDTMTVHHKEYYEDKAPPADWDEPTPVGYLTSWGKYLLAMTGPPQALDAAEALIRAALDRRGVGAKTSSGYGRARIERFVSPVRRDLDALAPPPVQPNTVTAVAEQLLRALERAASPDEAAAARRAVERVFGANKSVWRDWLAKGASESEGTRATLRRWFEPVLATPAAPAPAAPTKVEPPTTATAERRTMRAWFVPKDAKRFEVRFEGEKKTFKHHVLKLGDGVEGALRAAGEDGVVVEVEVEGGKPTKVELAR